MKKRFAVLFVPFAASLCVGHADMVAIHQKVSVTGQDSVCKAVTNESDTGLSLFVPTQTVDEWQTFYNNTPIGVQLSLCTCKAQTMNNCNISDTFYGSTSSGTCVAGFAGACSFSCANGVFTEVTNSCIKNCPATTINYCSLPTTTSGSTAAGTCSAGYGGSCSFQCSSGTWSQVSNSCSPSPPPPPPPPTVQSFGVYSSGSCTSGYCACGGPWGTKACGDLSYTSAWVCSNRGYANVVSATTHTLVGSTYVCSPLGCWNAPAGCEVCDIVTCGN